MGATISTVEESKAYNVAPRPPTLYDHHNHNHHDDRNRKYSDDNELSGCSLIEIKGADEAAYTNNYAPSFSTRNYDYNHKYKPSATNTRSKSPPAAALVPFSKTAKFHRVVYFHSSPACRGYLEASKASNSLIVIAFTDGWSGPCRYMEPIIHEFAAKYTYVDFLKINVDQLYDLSWEYEIQTTPTLLFMRNGKLLDEAVEPNKEELQKKIEKHNLKI